MSGLFEVQMPHTSNEGSVQLPCCSVAAAFSEPVRAHIKAGAVKGLQDSRPLFHPR